METKSLYNNTCNGETDHRFGHRLFYYYSLLFILSLVGNSLVLYIVCKYEKLNTVCNIFLLNLVISDMILMSGLPFWAVYHYKSNWIFGPVWCKISASFYFLGFYSSIMFLTLLTFDRYLAVVYAVPSTRLRRRSYAMGSSAAVWGISFLACINPFLLYNEQKNNLDKYICDEVVTGFDFLKLVLPYLQFSVFFLFPLILILYCYIRIAMIVISSRIIKKYRTVRLIFVIVLLFFLCWTPYNVVLMLCIGKNDECEKSNNDYNLHVTRMLTYVYFFINPIFYTFVGRRFQKDFRKLLVRQIPCLENYISVTGSNTVSHRNPEVGIAI